ncbi:MAG: alpha/beta hydrolase [Alcanivorax sediminis]|uniref:alpha/beta hydrolase n=1 Tax=Alcanivorax sediminis TaxID=2663008 RepID=UPI003C63BB1C
MKDSSKPPVLLIHGMWSDGETLHEVRDAFIDQGYTVDSVTLPFHRPRAEHSSASLASLARARLQDYVEYLVDHVQKMGAAPIVVGHSMGGLLAQLLAARVACDRLILLSSAAPAGINGLGWSVFRTLGRNLFLFPLWRSATSLGLANVQYGIGNAQSEVVQREIYSTCSYESGMVTFQMTLAAFSKHTFANVEPSSIRCPILIIGGVEDRITSIGVQRRIAQRYGDRCKLIEIPGCDHWTVGGYYFREIRLAMFNWLEETAPALPDTEALMAG